jgi:glycerol-3-phosphate dehydrogenase
MEYDVVVIGGGIYGISVARDAALRGLTVALVEQGDFGNATSSNLHKIIHGGLRYLQDGDLKRMRESIRERSILLRIAPHLVHPIPCLIPTYRHSLQNKLLMSLACIANDLISADRNRQLKPHKKIPRGRVISKAECLQLCPELDQRDLTGAAIYYDAQVYNPDRLNLSLLLSAMKTGADAANYAQVIGFLRNGRAVTGIKVKDLLSGTIFEIRARMVVNCTGPWTNSVLRPLGLPSFKNIGWCKAMVLVTRPLVQDIALGLLGRTPYEDRDALFNKGYRLFFVTPWRSKSLIGTFQAPYDGHPDDFEVTERDVADYLQEINAALPKARISRGDLHFVYRGLLPVTKGQDHTRGVNLIKHHQIHDHLAEEGIEGLVSVLGVKYSTARDIAEKLVDFVVKRLNRTSLKCRTAVTPVHGGDTDCFQAFVAHRLERPAGATPESFAHLLRTYGSEYEEILDYCKDDPELGCAVMTESPVIKAEVVHGIRREMAQKLADVIFRRTDLGTAGYPGDYCLATCAEIMAAELGWDEHKTELEIDEVKSVFRSRGQRADIRSESVML